MKFRKSIKQSAAYSPNERSERFEPSLSFSTNFPLDKIVGLSYNIYIIVIMLNKILLR